MCLPSTVHVLIKTKRTCADANILYMYNGGGEWEAWEMNRAENGQVEKWQSGWSGRNEHWGKWGGGWWCVGGG